MYETHLLFSLALWLVVLWWYSRQSEASAFHPVFYYLAFHGVVFVIRPLVKAYNNYQSIYVLYQFSPTDWERHLTVICANLGMIAFCGMCHAVCQKPIRFNEIQPGTRPGKSLIIALVLSSPLILASFKYVLSNNFGDEDLLHLQRLSATQTVLTDTTGYIVDANVMLGSFAVAIAWAYRFRLWALAPMLLFIGLRASVGRGRWTFIMVAASFGLTLLYERRQRWLNARLLMVAVIILPLFTMLGENRSAVSDFVTGRTSNVAALEKPRNDLFDSMDFANLEYLEFVIHFVPDVTGTYDYFLKNLEVLTAPIPRILWSEKPAGPPIKLYDLSEYGNPIGLTWSVVGEGYQDLGVIGVAIWCGLGGIFWGYIYKWFVSKPANSIRLLYYALFLPLSVQWFRDGVLITLVKFPLFVLLPIAITQLVASAGVKPRNGMAPRRIAKIPAKEPQ